MAGIARQQLGLDVVTTTFEEFETSERYDLITMIQIVAHFANPRLAMQKAANLLVPKGLLLVETWDRRSLLARLLGSNWHEYSPPTVLHWFSAIGLRELGFQFNLSHLRSGRMLKWISGGHAKSLLRYTSPAAARRRLIDRSLNLVPDGLALPYPGDDLFWSLFQKNS